MSRYNTKQELLEDITNERQKLNGLLGSIPEERYLDEVTDGMSIKDFVAHRMEWGSMMIGWYKDTIAGKEPSVPSKDYKWNQLKELNALIFDRYKTVDYKKIWQKFNEVHNELFKMVSTMSENELFSKHYYKFTGRSDLATYIASSTASHYRSARRHIQKWWRNQGG